MSVTRQDIEGLYEFDEQLGTFSAKDTDAVMAVVSPAITEALNISPNPNPSTPIGRLIERDTLFVADAIRLNVQNANQLILSAAAGQQLDAIAQWFAISRKPATPTSVQATLRGTPGATIPSGVKARTSAGAVFSLVASVTLDSSTGEGDGIFECTETGPVVCFAGELDTIDTAYGGWSSVYNEADAVPGRDIETDDSLRTRIQESRFTGPGFLGSIKNALDAIDGVNSAMVVENSAGDVQTVRGIDDMAPHSIFVCADCEDSEVLNSAIATAILNTKPPGVSFHRIIYTIGGGSGSDASPEQTVADPTETAFTATDAFGNQYPVWFYRPIPVAVNVGLTVKNRSYTGTDLFGDIKSAIASWAVSHGFRVGETVYAIDITEAVEQALPGVVVISSNVNDGGINADDSLQFLDMAANQKASFPPNGDEWLTVTEL